MITMQNSTVFLDTFVDNDRGYFSHKFDYWTDKVYQIVFPCLKVSLTATFKADSDWKMIDLPFENFQRRRGSNEKTLDAKNITSFAIVAYGRDFTSDVSASTIEFYY